MESKCATHPAAPRVQFQLKNNRYRSGGDAANDCHVASDGMTTRRKETNAPPPAQGLYHPAQEHDACGIGFVANVRGHKSHEIISKGLQVLLNLAHRGACG